MKDVAKAFAVSFASVAGMLAGIFGFDWAYRKFTKSDSKAD